MTIMWNSWFIGRNFPGQSIFVGICFWWWNFLDCPMRIFDIVPVARSISLFLISCCSLIYISDLWHSWFLCFFISGCFCSWLQCDCCWIANSGKWALTAHQVLKTQIILIALYPLPVSSAIQGAGRCMDLTFVHDIKVVHEMAFNFCFELKLMDIYRVVCWIHYIHLHFLASHP